MLLDAQNRAAALCAERYIAPASDHPMRRTDRTGQVCHWRVYEELLDLV
jgi:Xaa-Pro dipeptidase